MRRFPSWTRQAAMLRFTSKLGRPSGLVRCWSKFVAWTVLYLDKEKRGLKIAQWGLLILHFNLYMPTIQHDFIWLFRLSNIKYWEYWSQSHYRKVPRWGVSIRARHDWKYFLAYKILKKSNFLSKNVFF